MLMGQPEKERSARENGAALFHLVRQFFWSQMVLNLRGILLILGWLRFPLPNQAAQRMRWLWITPLLPSTKRYKESLKSKHHSKTIAKLVHLHQ
jgi:hypothetical protein